MYLKKILIIGMLASLMACSSQAPHVPNEELHPAVVDMAEASVSVSRTLNDLANIKSAESQLLQADNQGQLPLTLTQLITVDWSGPVEPLLKQVAQATQMQLKVVGHEPAIPVIVSLDRHESPAYDLLEDIRGQVFDKANVVVFPTSGVIQLSYL